MAEPGLSLAYDDFRQGIADFLGFGRTIVNWSADQSAEIIAVLDAGLRHFYYPDPLPGQRIGHRWSFLRASAALALSADQGNYSLPDDFGAFEGPLTYSGTDSPSWVVQQTSESHVMDKRSVAYGNQSSHRPTWVAVRPLRTPHVAISTRWEAVFAPVPSQEYKLTYRYQLLPQPLSSTVIYPLGGQAHSELLMESCLAMAEQRLDDQIGIHSQRYLHRLATSIRYDRQITEGENLGYNRDDPVNRNLAGRSRFTVTVGGATPT